MTQQPPGAPPWPPQPPRPVVITATPVKGPARRPGWVTALGVISIVLGALDFVLSPFAGGLGVLLRVGGFVGFGDGVRILGHVALSSAVGALLVLAGIGLLRRADWGRLLGMAWAVLALHSATGTLLNLVRGLSPDPAVLCAMLLSFVRLSYSCVLLGFLMPRQRGDLFR